MVKLSDVAFILNGDRSSDYPSDKDFIHDGEPFINAGHLKNKKVDYTDMVYISEAKYNSLSGAKLLKNDILFCIRGSVGKFALVEKDGGAPASSIAVIRAKKDKIDVQYLVQLISSDIFKKLIEVENNGSSQPQLSANSVLNFQIPLPDLCEQKKIAEFLSDMDALISSLETLIEKKQAIKQACLQKMFPKEDKDFPEIRFPEFSEPWRHCKLGRLARITTGKLDANAMTENGLYDFYTSGKQTYKIDTPAFSGPAITIAGNGSAVGYMHLADGLFNAYQRTYVLTDFKVNRNYLYMAIGNALPKKIKEEARTGNIPYIVLDMLTDLQVSLPCEEEQNQIGDFFNNLDNTISVYQRKLEKYQKIKQGMMEQLLTGKIRLV